MELEIKPKNDNILGEYKIKYKPEELTDDGIPTTETLLREIKEKDDEIEPKLKTEEFYKKQMIQRVKCICLNKLGYDILYNTFNMSPKERIKLQELMWTYNDIEHSKIIDEFNEIVNIEIFENKNIDISQLPIYNFV